VILKIDANQLLTADSEFCHLEFLPSTTSVHAIMAVALTINASREKRILCEWIATWPDQESVESSFPMFWDRQYQSLLPSAAQG
jgi:hypothetical protein